MKFVSFIKAIMTAQSGISSKRFCGVIGWLCTIGWITYYVVVKKDMPGILETFMICTVTLLGIDTIPKSINAFNKKDKSCQTDSKKQDMEQQDKTQ